mmetsp:Transcript_90910/g.294173  ORF Transcript_90910/g.294173 Transcript_90910/m.294173 type:complete len:881 (-) Transcript_90910:146-2788(-)
MPLAMVYVRAVVLGFAVALAADASHEYVTEEDLRVARLADKEMELYCDGSGFKGHVDPASGRGSLEASLGGENVMVSVLKEAENEEEVKAIMLEKYGVAWLAWRGLATIMSFIMLLTCIFFCLFSRCRCCAKEQPTRDVWKLRLAILIGVVMLGLVICTFWSLRGYWAAQDGIVNSQCTSARVLDVLLRGQKEAPAFVGLLPLLKQFSELETAVADGSIMRGGEGILGQTDEIHRSVTLARETMKLLLAMTVENHKPKTSSGHYLLHKCQICEVLNTQLKDAIKMLDGSVASKIGKSRREVEANLNADDKDRLHKNMETTIANVVKIKDTVRHLITSMLDDKSNFKTLKKFEHVTSGLLLAAVLLITCSPFLLGLCATTSLYRFARHEMDPEKEEAGVENPYNKNVYQYAHSTWCWGFFYASNALFVSGLLFILAAPVSGVCLLMDELEGNTIEEIAPAIGMDMTSDDGIIVRDVVEKCFQPSKNSVDQYLLDILFSTEGNMKITSREKLNNWGQDAAASKFAHITQTMAEPVPRLLEDPIIKNLRQVVEHNPAAAMIVSEAAALASEGKYADLKADSRGASGLKAVVESSVACEDHVISAGAGNLAGTKTYGISSIVQRLEGLGRAKGSQGCCAKKVVCRSDLSHSDKHACAAGNNFIDLKNQVKSDAVFRCDMFQKPGGTDFCDPLGMQRFEGAYTDDCLSDDAKMTVKEKTCNLEEFTVYVRKFHERLGAIFQRLDEQMATELPSLRASIRTLMNDHVMSRTDAIANGVTCNFLSSYYQEMINGLCYQGVWGVRVIARAYVWCAVLSVPLTLAMYAVWCRSKGNYENWNVDRTDYNSRKKQMEEEAAEEARRAKRRQDGTEEEKEIWILAKPPEDRS